jgi:hypothetical protein
MKMKAMFISKGILKSRIKVGKMWMEERNITLGFLAGWSNKGQKSFTCKEEEGKVHGQRDLETCSPLSCVGWQVL